MIQSNSIVIIGSDKTKEDLFRSVLQFLNIDLIFSPDAKDGFNQVKNHPSLVILDYECLKLKALEFCIKVKGFQIYQRIPIIIVSIPVEDSDQLASSGADALLLTPFSPGILKATVSSWLKVNQAEKERALSQAKVTRLTSMMMKKMTEDISAQKKIESVLNSALVSRDLFLSIASHELKTPISALKMQIQMGQRLTQVDSGKVPPPEKLEKIFSVSSRQIDRLTSLIDDLLDVSRIEAGKLSYNLERINLSDLVKEISEHYSEITKLAKSNIEIDIEENIFGNWDRYRMEQVVSNLLSNAVKYGAAGNIQVRLIKREDSFAVLSVRDSGLGIAQEKIGKVFDRFERAISATNISGLGLGLYITRTIVEGHRGSISVESRIGEGSTFTVVLPIHDEASGSAE